MNNREDACGQAALPPPLMPGIATINRQMYTITINEVVNGFVIQVGCKMIVFESRVKMLLELERYLSNRAEVENEYLAKEGK